MTRTIRLSASTGTAAARLRAAPAADMAHLSGLVVPWGTEFTRMGGIRFVFTADSLRLPDDLSTVKLLVQHDDERPVGYAVDAQAADDGLRMTFALPDHPRAADVLDEAALNLRDGFSVGIEVDDDVLDEAFDAAFDGQTDPITMRGVLRETSIVSVPQFNSARIANRAPALLTLSKETDMPEADTLPTVEAAAATFTETPEFLELRTRVRDLETLGATGDAQARHRLARFASLSDALVAGLKAQAKSDRISLALVDNTSNAGKNAGVVPPGWSTEVHGIIARVRAAIEAFGGPGSLPDSGMDTAWPYFDGLLNTLVGVQATQKTDITSVAVDIKKGTAPVKTYAGGADNALQLIERSSPSYLEAWARIMLAAYAVVTDAAFVAAVYAAGTGTQNLESTGMTADAVRAALFGASNSVDTATGAPAEFALVAPDLFAVLGGLAGLHNPDYGTFNAAGTSSARSLAINVNGLPVIKVPGLGAGTGLVSNREAARWVEDGPAFIDAYNVSKLGRDSAVYGYAATEVYIPAGIVKLVDPVVLAASSGRK